MLAERLLSERGAPCTSSRRDRNRSGSGASVNSAAGSRPRRSCPRSSNSKPSSASAWHDDAFRERVRRRCSSSYAGRPTPVTECHRLSERLGVRVLLKREDLTHTGSHKINNVLGQALLTRRMGKRRVIAETGAGQHGVATATAAALFGLGCTVYMGAVDVERQALNVWRMKLLGAEVVPVRVGERDAEGRGERGDARRGSRASRRRTTASVRRWVRTRSRGWCASSSASSATKRAGNAARSSAATIPMSWSRASAADRTRSARSRASSTPTRGSSASKPVGSGSSPVTTARRCSAGVPGVVHGMRSLFLQDEYGQVLEATSISAGLDYPGVGPEHAMLAASGRAEYYSATDEEALEGFQLLAATEGIVPALEPAHAIGWLAREAGHVDARPARPCWSRCRDAATRTRRRSRRRWASR